MRFGGNHGTFDRHEIFGLQRCRPGALGVTIELGVSLLRGGPTTTEVAQQAQQWLVAEAPSKTHVAKGGARCATKTNIESGSVQSGHSKGGRTECSLILDI